MDVLTKDALQRRLTGVIVLAGCMFLMHLAFFLVFASNYDDLVLQITELIELEGAAERSVLRAVGIDEPIVIALLEVSFGLLSLLYMCCLLLCSIFTAIKGKKGISRGASLSDLRGWVIVGICVSAISGMVIQLGLYISCNKRLAAAERKKEREMTIIGP